MENKIELIKLATDTYRGRLQSNFSKGDSLEVLRQAFIELNGGSTKLNFKALRRNGAQMFEIIEEIIDNTVIEGLADDSFFNQFVEYKNISAGDENSFYVPDNTMLVVSEIADGTTALRRQRIDNGTNVSIATSWKGIKIYEHLTRLMSGRVDFNVMLDGISKALKTKVNDDMYTAFTGSFASLPSTFNVSGAYSEDAMLALVEHVEASTGKTAMLAGTRTALRKVTTATVSDAAKEDMYNMGYYGSFNGVPMMRIKQVHNVGTYTFKLSESDVYVVTTDEKPIKFVTEGESRILSGDALANKDLTQEYFVADKYGAGVVITDLFGKYAIS